MPRPSRLQRAAAEAARVAAAAVLALAFIWVPLPAAAQAVVVGSKFDTEGSLLGAMILTLLARHGIAVENRLGLGPTEIVRAAILAGQIDIYPEYTGDGAQFFRRETDPAWRDAARGYATVKALDLKQNKLVWLAPAPVSNSWTIATRRAFAKAQHLASFGDLARYLRDGGRLRLAASAEFVETPNALPAFEAAYGFTLRLPQLLILAGGDTAATLHAAAEGTSGVNAGMAYATDGALAALDLVALADDKHSQIIYEPAPVVRQAVLARHPEIATLLDPAFRSLTLPALQRLNAEISVDGRAAGAVAKDYLQAKGLLR